MKAGAEMLVCVCIMHVCKCNMCMSDKMRLEKGKACSSNSMDEAGMRFLVRVLMKPNFN